MMQFSRRINAILDHTANPIIIRRFIAATIAIIARYPRDSAGMVRKSVRNIDGDDPHGAAASILSIIREMPEPAIGDYARAHSRGPGRLAVRFIERVIRDLPAFDTLAEYAPSENNIITARISQDLDINTRYFIGDVVSITACRRARFPLIIVNNIDADEIMRYNTDRILSLLADARWGLFVIFVHNYTFADSEYLISSRAFGNITVTLLTNNAKKRISISHIAS